MLRESNATEDVLSPPPTPQLLGECLRQRRGLDCGEWLWVPLVLSETPIFVLVDTLLNSKFHCLVRVTTLPLVLICCFMLASTPSFFFLVTGESPFPDLPCHTIFIFTKLLCHLFYPIETTWCLLIIWKLHCTSGYLFALLCASSVFCFFKCPFKYDQSYMGCWWQGHRGDL